MVFDPDPECAAANSKLSFCFGGSCEDGRGRLGRRPRRRPRRKAVMPIRRMTTTTLSMMAAVTPGGVVLSAEDVLGEDEAGELVGDFGSAPTDVLSWRSVVRVEVAMRSVEAGAVAA